MDTKTQRQNILRLLQEKGLWGVNSYDLTYKYGYKQAPTRIHELKQKGYSIRSKRNRNGSVNYILLHDTPTSKPLEDEYTWVFDNKTNTAYRVLKSEAVERQEALL